MPASYFLLAFLASFTTSSACDYDFVAGLRDQDVAKSFDGSKMAGFWYENGYADPAQVGSKCPTLNFTYNQAKGQVDCDFAVDYGPLPFTIQEHYVHQNRTGVFRKSASAPFHIPGGSLIGLPTAIVKAELSSDKSRYESVVMYSCKLGKLINEIVIATRGPTIEDAYYQAILKELKEKGVPDIEKVQRVDFSDCKKQQPSVVV